MHHSDTEALTDSEKKVSKWDFKTVFTICTAVIVAIVVVVGSIYTISTVPLPVPKIEFPVSNIPLGVYRYASVAADAGPCSEIGVSILAKDGSAVDAAIAAAICTGVYNMHNAGIGGGFFMTIWDQASQMSYVVDAREMAPLNSTEDMFEHNNVSSTLGPYAIAIPGEIAGYWAAHQKFGRVPWKDLFEPSIKLCTNGIEVSGVLAGAIADTLGEIDAIEDKTPFMKLVDFLTNNKTGKPYKKGDKIHCLQLADTFTRIAEFGGPDYYNGSLSKDILADLKDAGSPINETDLASYEAKFRKPVQTVLQNHYKIVSTPPPGSGSIMSFILNILSGYNFNEASSQDTLTYHRFIEALKFAYAKRTYLGDDTEGEDYAPDIEMLVKNMTTPAYGEYIRSMINDSYTHPTSFYDPDLKSPPRIHGTSHISALDALGNAVAVTSTINTYFGSGIMGQRTGIIFNDEMDDFSSPNETNSFNLPPAPHNFIRPGKRPQSSTAPSVILVPDMERDPSGNTSTAILVVGAAGGSRITSTTAYVTMRVLWFKETVKQALDALRFHHQLLPETLYYEKNMPWKLISAMQQKGHVNQTLMSAIAIAQAIQRRDGKVLGCSDWRKDGLAYADGY